MVEHPERVLIGKCLYDSNALADATAVVRASDFADAGCQALWLRMVDKLAAGHPIAVETIGSGDPDYSGLAMELWSQTATGIGAEHLAKQVVAAGTRRRLIRALEAAAREAIDADAQVEQVVDRSLRAILAATARGTAGSGWSASDLMHKTYLAIERAEPTPVVTTGFADLDHLLAGGLRQGELMLIGARPGVGKTSVALASAQAAARVGANVVFVSLEMSAEALACRLIAQVSRVDLRDMLARRLHIDDWRRITDAMAERDNWAGRMRIYDSSNGGLTLGQIATLLRRESAQKFPCSVMIVDYLQLVSCAKRESRRVEVTEISRGLKQLAGSQKLAIIALSQLTREAEGRPGEENGGLRRPSKRDLMESGALEADADVVMLLWSDGTPGILRAEIDKVRNGPQGRFMMAWNGRSCLPANYTARIDTG